MIDDSHLYFAAESGKEHWVRLITGNGIDLISDYSYTPAFEIAMESFDAEEYA